MVSCYAVKALFEQDASDGFSSPGEQHAMPSANLSCWHGCWEVAAMVSRLVILSGPHTVTHGPD